MAKRGIRSVDVKGYTKEVDGKTVHVKGYSRKKAKNPHRRHHKK